MERLIRRALRRLRWIGAFYFGVGCLGIGIRLASGRGPVWPFAACAVLSLVALTAACRALGPRSGNRPGRGGGASGE